MSEDLGPEGKQPPTIDCPPTWTLTSLAAIADVALGKTPGKDDYRSEGKCKIVKYRDLGDDREIVWTNREKGFIECTRAQTMNLRRLSRGDVLISASAHSSEIIGRKVLYVHYLPDDFDAVYYVGEILCIRVAQEETPDLPKLLNYFFQSIKGYKTIQAKVHGVHLIASRAAGMVVPVPPKANQQRIVSKIDELFSRIEEGERALERVQKLVRRYRQSVLKAAVTGELTRDWREKNNGQLESGEVRLARIHKAHREAWEKSELDKMKAKGITLANDGWKVKYEEPGDVVTDYLGDLPGEWQRVRIDAVGEVQLGRQRSPAHHEGEFMRPYLRVANVHQERIDISDVMSMNFTPEEFVTYSLRRGDILLNEGQSKELIGRPAMYGDEVPGACFTNTLVRFRATSAVLPEFALIVFLHYMKSGDFQKIAKITTNIAHLGAGRFAEMSFPVPREEEQRQIVDRVDRQSSVYSQLIAEVVGRRRHVSSLRQSVLKAAFSGALVPQDSSDESASLLLERIAHERSDASVQPRRRPKNRTQERV